MAAGQGEREIRGGRATGRRVLTPRGQRTRAGLVAAAAEIFEETPFAQVRLTDITTRAGVAAGTFYTYFDSKEEIFREVAVAALADMSESARLDESEYAADPVAAITAATTRYFHTCLRHTGVARSMEQLAVSDDDVARSRRSTVIVGVKRIERLIRRLQADGVCDDDIDTWEIAMVLHTMNVRVAYDHLLSSGNVDDVDRLVAAITRVWARTLGLEPKEAPRSTART